MNARRFTFFHVVFAQALAVLLLVGIGLLGSCA